MKTEIAMNLQSATVRGVRREVLSLRQAPYRLFASAADRFDWYIFADAGGFMRLAELASVAATARGPLVYVPPSKDRLGEASYFDQRPASALIFAHHTAQFRPSDWRELRRRLNSPRPVRRSTRRWVREEDREYSYRAPDSDPVDLAGDTEILIVTGSTLAFQRLADNFLGMSGSYRDDHFHFQDTFELRQAPGPFGNRPTPDVICCKNIRWQVEPEFDLAFDYRWIYPGLGLFAGIGPEEAKRRLAEDGWEFVRRNGGEYMFRQRVG